MSGITKRHILQLGHATGLNALSRTLIRWPRVIMYHQFSGTGAVRPTGTNADVFRRQLIHIKRHYYPVTLRRLCQMLVEEKEPAARTVVLTVDDGYASFARVAFPLLQEFAIPVTLFVVSDLARNGGWLWHDKFAYLRQRVTDVAELQGSRAGQTHRWLKQIHPTERDQWLVDLSQRSGVIIPDTPPAECQLLTLKELRTLASSGLVEIGSHSRTHPILGTINHEQAWNEISLSRRELEEQLDVQVVSFCYPNGHFGDYGPEHMAMLQEAGYVCAAASHFGYVTPRSERYAIPRIGGSGADLPRFRKYIDGLEWFQRHFEGYPAS